MARPNSHPSEVHVQESRRAWIAAVSVVSLALLVRLIYLFESSSSVVFDLPLVDSETYDRLARQLVSGAGLTDEFFWQPIFYPLFLSGVYLVTGGSVLAAKLLQVALGALTCGLTFRLGREVRDLRTGLVAGLLAAFCGPLLFFDTELLATGWAAFWSIALLLLFLAAGRRTPPGEGGSWRSLSTVAALGLGLGLATITRPTFLPFALAGVLWLAIRWRKRGASVIALLAGLSVVIVGFLVVVLPVVSLSARVTGRATFLPASAGINLFIGNNPERAQTLNIRPGWEWERLTRSPRLEGVTEKTGTSSYFSGRVREYATTDPTGFTGGLAAKSVEMLSSRELPRNLDLYLFRNGSTTLSVLVWKANGFGFPVGILLPLAVLGLVRMRTQVPLLLYLFLLFYPCAVVLVFVSSRYRTPILPVLSIFAAAGALGLIDSFRRRERRELALSAAVFAAVLLAATLPGPFPQERDDFEAELHFLVGRRAADQGDLELAMNSQRSALAADPSHANANSALARLLDARGQTDEAIAHYEQALEAEPDHPIALANLGRVLARRKELDRALRLLEWAIEVTPLDTELYEDCATVLAWQGQLLEALEYLDRALLIRPDDPDLHYRRGRILGALNRFDAALSALEASLQLDDLNGEALDALAELLVRGRNRGAARELYESAIERAQAAGIEDLEQHLRARLRILEIYEP